MQFNLSLGVMLSFIQVNNIVCCHFSRHQQAAAVNAVHPLPQLATAQHQLDRSTERSTMGTTLHPLIQLQPIRVCLGSHRLLTHPIRCMDRRYLVRRQPIADLVMREVPVFLLQHLITISSHWKHITQASIYALKFCLFCCEMKS